MNCLKSVILGWIIIGNLGCSTGSQQVEKRLYKCIIEYSKGIYDREVEVNQIDLSEKFEALLISEGYINENKGTEYHDLYNSMIVGKTDTARLSSLLKKAHIQNLDLLGYPTLQLTPYGCIINIREENSTAFESSESLTRLWESYEAYKKTMGLETIVTSITNSISDTEFREKIVYRIPVITAMYSIMEQTYSRHWNRVQERNQKEDTLSTYAERSNTIKAFYKLLNQEQAPTVKETFLIFHPEMEWSVAHIEYSDDQEGALKHINSQNELQESLLFRKLREIHYQLQGEEFEPNITNQMSLVPIKDKDNTIKAVFSSHEKTLEIEFVFPTHPDYNNKVSNIYLENGESILKLIGAR